MRPIPQPAITTAADAWSAERKAVPKRGGLEMRECEETWNSMGRPLLTISARLRTARCPPKLTESSPAIGVIALDGDSRSPRTADVHVECAEHSVQILIPVVTITAIVEDHAALDLMRKEIACL